MKRDLWLSLDIALPIVAATAIFAVFAHLSDLIEFGRSHDSVGSIPWDAYTGYLVAIAGIATALSLIFAVFDFRSGRRARPIIGICLSILLWPLIYLLLWGSALATV